MTAILSLLMNNIYDSNYFLCNRLFCSDYSRVIILITTILCMVSKGEVKCIVRCIC